jgi:predicted ester cyclase
VKTSESTTTASAATGAAASHDPVRGNGNSSDASSGDTPENHVTPARRVDVAVRSILLMGAGQRAEFEPLYHPGAVDRENRIQPPSSRVTGPDGFWSTAQWLRAAFDGLHYEIHHALATDDLVAVNSSMVGTHTAPWVVYADDGSIDSVFPPTRRPFRMTQSHWFRFREGRIVEHWANRDDLGMARQVGWLPPTPAYVVRMALAKRRAQRP